MLEDRLAEHERFPNQAVDADGNLIEEVMMVTESEPINFNQAINDSNWLAAMQEELMEIEKNKTRELVGKSTKKPIDMKWVVETKAK